MPKEEFYMNSKWIVARAAKGIIEHAAIECFFTAKVPPTSEGKITIIRERTHVKLKALRHASNKQMPGKQMNPAHTHRHSKVKVEGTRKMHVFCGHFAASTCTTFAVGILEFTVESIRVASDVLLVGTHCTVTEALQNKARTSSVLHGVRI